MRVILDGSIFEIEGSVTRSPLVEWPENTRLDGQQKRKDRRYISSWAFDNWSGGLGIQNQNVELASHQYRIWDAENVDTRYANQIVLSPAYNVCTINPSRGDLDHVLQHLDQIYLVESQRSISFAYGSTAVGIAGNAFRFTPPNTFGSFSILAQGYQANINASCSVGSISAIYALGAQIGFVACEVVVGTIQNNRLLAIPTLGGTISAGSVRESQTLIPGTISLNRIGRMTDLGGTLQFIEHRADNTVRFLSADSGFQNPGILKTVNTIVGTQLAPLISDGVKVYAHLAEGIYNFDTTPDIEISTQRSQDKNPVSVLFHNMVHFKNKKTLIMYDGTDVTSVGYDRDDGLPSDKMGEITAMASSWQSVFAAVYGATFSHILSMNRDHKWQYYARMPSTGVWVKEMWLSDSPDGIDRLWVLPNTGYPGYFLNPMINPLNAATYAYNAAGGYVEPPVIDGGLLEEQGSFYRVLLSAKNNAAVGNAIALFHSQNGVSPATTSYIGNFPSPNSSFLYGSPYGVTSYSLQNRIRLSRTSGEPDTNALIGTTPVFKGIVVNYLKIPDTRELFTFNIDLEQTARLVGQPVEAVIGTLDTIRDTRTLMPFYYGLVGTKNVKVLEMPVAEEVEKDNYLGGERKGMMKITVAEII